MNPPPIPARTPEPVLRDAAGAQPGDAGHAGILRDPVFGRMMEPDPAEVRAGRTLCHDEAPAGIRLRRS